MSINNLDGPESKRLLPVRHAGRFAPVTCSPRVVPARSWIILVEGTICDYQTSSRFQNFRNRQYKLINDWPWSDCADGCPGWSGSTHVAKANTYFEPPLLWKLATPMTYKNSQNLILRLKYVDWLISSVFLWSTNQLTWVWVYAPPHQSLLRKIVNRCQRIFPSPPEYFRNRRYKRFNCQRQSWRGVGTWGGLPLSRAGGTTRKCLK